MAFCLAQEFRKIASEMTRHDLWLQVYFQLGWMAKFHLNHYLSLSFLQCIFISKQKTAQWVYDKTIAKSKFFQNTCTGSWLLCKEWKQVTLSEAALSRHLCSTNHVVTVWERGKISLWYRWKWLSVSQSVAIRRGTEIVSIYVLF